MKKKLFVALAMAGFALSGLAGPAAAADPMVIKFSHVNTDNTPKGYGALKFKELAEKRLAGKVKVEVYPNSTLFGDAQEMEALLLGDVQIIAPSMSKLHKYTDKLLVFDLPFLFDDIAAVDRFQATPTGQSLLSAVEDRGYTGLGFLHNGMKQFSARTNVVWPDDMKGIKCRIQPSDVIESYVKAVGAIPHKMAFSEVYQGLQTGVVDCQENSWTSIYTMKFYEVQPTIVESNHGLMDFIVLVGTKWWKGLPDDLRRDLKAAMTDAVAEANTFADKMHADNKKKIMASGRNQVVTLDKKQLEAWRAAMRPVYDKFEGKIGEDLVKAARAANAATN